MTPSGLRTRGWRKERPPLPLYPARGSFMCGRLQVSSTGTGGGDAPAVSSPLSDDPLADGKRHCMRSVFGLKLSTGIAQMKLHRAFRLAQDPCRLGVLVTSGRPVQTGLFASRQPDPLMWWLIHPAAKCVHINQGGDSGSQRRATDGAATITLRGREREQ